MFQIKSPIPCFRQAFGQGANAMRALWQKPTQSHSESSGFSSVNKQRDATRFVTHMNRPLGMPRMQQEMLAKYRSVTRSVTDLREEAWGGDVISMRALYMLAHNNGGLLLATEGKSEDAIDTLKNMWEKFRDVGPSAYEVLDLFGSIPDSRKDVHRWDQVLLRDMERLSFQDEIQAKAEGVPYVVAINAFLQGQLGRLPTRAEVRELVLKLIRPLRDSYDMKSMPLRIISRSAHYGQHIYQIYTQEFISAYAIHLNQRVIDFREQHQRDPVIVEVCAGDGFFLGFEFFEKTK